MSTKAREKSPKEQLADVLARLPGMKRWIIKQRCKKRSANEAQVQARDGFSDCIQVIESIPAMLEQAKRETDKDSLGG